MLERMRDFLRWLWRFRLWGALTFLGMVVLLGSLYLFTLTNVGEMPFFYTTR